LHLILRKTGIKVQVINRFIKTQLTDKKRL